MSLRDVVDGVVDELASPPTIRIEAATWHSTAARLRDAGATVFEWLTAVDRGDGIDIALHVRGHDDAAGVIVVARVPYEGIASLREVWAGAAWHERETAEMFGVAFIDHDTQPLLLRDVPHDRPPLLRATALPRRVETQWPGRVEPGETEQDRARRARRGPVLPPGVRPEWLPTQESS